MAVSSSELAVIKQLPAIFKARLENQSVDSRLRWVNPEFNEDTRKLNIKLDIINPLSEQRGGLRFELPLQIKTEGLLITKSAVSNRYENPRVTIVSTGESIPLLILGETTDHFIVAEDQRLKVGIKILIRTTK